VTSARRGIYRGWWIVVVSATGLAVSVGTVVVYSFAVFLKPLSQEFGWTRSQVSLAISLMNVMVTVGSPGAGRLADRLGSRTVILPSIVSLAAVLASLFFLTPHLPMLYLLYALVGLVGLGATPLTYSRAVATWFDRRRGLALGLTTSGIGVGAFVMPSLAQWIISEAGWRWAYAALGLLVLLIPLPLVWLFLREAGTSSDRPRDGEGAAPAPGPQQVRAEAVRTRVFWQMLALFFLISACINGTVAHLSALLTDRGLSVQAAALAVSSFGGAAFAGRIVTGYLVDRFFAPRVIAVFFGGAALALVLLAEGSTS
jgi:predicted MFS family arabinose efflux permease